MFLKEMEISRFRQFNNVKLKFGKYLTSVSGFNATGKSTILALLAQCGESKRKPILHTKFRADLSEIIKFSNKHDERISYIGSLYFEEYPVGQNPYYPSRLDFRAAIQEHGKRYRILPKRTKTRPTEKKLEWPTLYLGLGRLYPIGESEEITRLNVKLKEEDINYIIEKAKWILMLHEDIKDFTAININETSKKKGLGFNSETYDDICNSAGQDNLGQILLAVLSFKKLKEELQEKWCGGLLLIDEIDTTLHPAAQNRLIQYLFREAKKIGFQVVFTTHSLSLLEYLCNKTVYNINDQVNDIEIIYITNANYKIDILQTPIFETIYWDLTVNYESPDTIKRKVSVFSEDKEARLFIEKILEEYSYRINLLNIKIGHEELLKLLISDFKNFSRYLFILDGDVEDSTIYDYASKISRSNLNCVVKLPGGNSPEKVIWNYILEMDDTHPFLSYQHGITKRNLEERGPESGLYNGYSEERQRYKQWFNDNWPLISELIYYWMNDNKEEVDNFINNFIEAYNKVARLNFIPQINRR